MFEKNLILYSKNKCHIQEEDNKKVTKKRQKDKKQKKDRHIPE